MADNEFESWKPDRPVSKGSTAYHNAVANAKYYLENVDELVIMALPDIKEGDVVADFGAGTGVSAMRLLQQSKNNFKLILVDNSPAWLGKAYEVLSGNKNVEFFLLEKTEERYATLAETVGEEIIDIVLSSNTVHLIPNIGECFNGVFDSLKPNGKFIFQSGNIFRKGREEGTLMIDDTVKRVHDIAVEMVRTDKRYTKYKNDLDAHIQHENSQRKFVFPEPKTLEYYTKALEDAGFKVTDIHHKTIKIAYKDWLDFLRVKRLQAGILPEIGGKEPTPEEEQDRDDIITAASKALFKELEGKNPLADEKEFTTEWMYVTALKEGKEPKGERMKKVALITGASKGIGKAIAMELARNKFDVIVHYNSNEKEAARTAEEIKRLGVDCLTVKSDISKYEDCEKMIQVISKRFGSLDVLVNNAGAIADKTLKNMTKEQWELVINVNLNGIFNVTKNALEIFNDNGRIINISSVIGIGGNFGQTNYSASKAGIIGFTKSLAKELGKRKITVNAVAPGFVETNMTKNLSFFRKKIILALTALKRFGTPEDIANLVAFLASEKSAFITGGVIRIDGGFSI